MTSLKLSKKEQNKIISNNLKELLKLNDFTVYCKLHHVSKSGMMRHISFSLKDGTDITEKIALVTDYKMNTHWTALKVSGCGMDMGFHVVYGLSVKLYCENGYNHDDAYKLKSVWL